MFSNFFHKLFNPHCEKCLNEEMDRQAQILASRVCPYCEHLKMQLSIVQQERDRLLDSVLNGNKEPSPIELAEAPKAIQSFIPWSTRRRQLEEEDRQKAVELAKEAQVAVAKSKSTEELEKELLGE